MKKQKQFFPWFRRCDGWFNPRSGYSIQSQGNGLYDIANPSGMLILGEAVPALGLKTTANRDHRLSVQGA